MDLFSAGDEIGARRRVREERARTRTLLTDGEPEDLIDSLREVCVVGRADGPREAVELPPRYRNRRWCGTCGGRKETHSLRDARTHVALASSCSWCAALWVRGGYEAWRNIQCERPVKPRPHLCPRCGKGCTTAGHLKTHVEWCRGYPKRKRR